MTRSLAKHVLFSAMLSAAIFFPASFSFAEDSIKAPPPEAKQAAKPEAAPAADAPADSKTDAKSQPPMDDATLKKAEKYKEAAGKAYEAIKAIGTGLKKDDAKHFYMMYNNYNLIGTVKVVQKDVGNAIQACGTSNPDMKDNLDARYKTWDGAVSPIVKDANANVDNMILAQDYAKPDKIREAFKLLDNARAATNDYIEKKPVTSAEACKYLLTKMDSTQANLTTLLRSTLISFGRANPEEAKKPAPEKSDSEKAAVEAAKSAAEKPAGEKPAAAVEAEKPVAEKPAVEPAAGKPAASPPESMEGNSPEKPAEEKPAAEKPAAKTP